MRISVAMATYNGMKYIEKQLDSIRLQFLLPDEVIICDDASTDGTADFIENYIENHSLYGWRLYRNEKNIGFKRNFLSALSKTDGDIIFLCDQDDIWYKNKTDVMCRIMEKNKNILALCSSFDFIDKNGKKLNIKSKKSTSNHGLIRKKITKKALACFKLKTVLRSNIAPGCTMVISKELKDEFCKNTPSVLPHDWELNLVAAAMEELYFYNRPLSAYRIHSSNALGLDSAVKGRLAIAKEKLQAAETLGRYDEFYPLITMQDSRYTALKKRKSGEILKMFFSSGEYIRYYTLKERLGDIIFTLRK